MSKNKYQSLNVEPAAAETAPAAPAAEPPVIGTQEIPAVTPPHQWTQEEIEELKAKAAQASQLQDQWLRSVAELENFRKRAARERTEAVRYANEGLLQKLVPVLDNLEMAMAAAAAPNATVQSILTGVCMIQQQLKAALVEAGLEEVDATGGAFDPRWHEAVAHQDAPGVPEGQVTKQLRPGYRLRDRLLRPATVVVAKGTPAPAAS
jgi:molecular chaperone GrpE